MVIAVKMALLYNFHWGELLGKIGGTAFGELKIVLDLVKIN